MNDSNNPASSWFYFLSNGTTTSSNSNGNSKYYYYHWYAAYHVPRRQLLEGVPDPMLTLAAPIVAYWALSLLFHLLDASGWRWLEGYRIHRREEAGRRNLVGKGEVVWAVVFQQLMQTVLGLMVVGEDNDNDNDNDEGVGVGVGRMERLLHEEGARRIATACVGPAVAFLLGERPVLVEWLSDFAYWWAVPALQLLAAMFIIDTWQYFLHRWMHTNRFLYRHFHSWHHRLYVPYAFGSLYNHPVEGFFLDTLGAVVAEKLTGMNARQAMLLFTVSSLKTVDDHCGYRFPWDPIQRLTRNNSDYHDIHHQAVGVKSNFSQPFFVHWDDIMGTRMTREELVRLRSQRRKEKSL